MESGVKDAVPSDLIVKSKLKQLCTVIVNCGYCFATIDRTITIK